VVGLVGLGAAGLGIAQLLRGFGVQRLVGTDLRSEATGRLAQLGGQGLSLEETLRRSQVVIAQTGAKGLIPARLIQRGQIILALSNPDPEIEPADALAAGAAVAADARAIAAAVPEGQLVPDPIKGSVHEAVAAAVAAAADSEAGVNL